MGGGGTPVPATVRHAPPASAKEAHHPGRMVSESLVHSKNRQFVWKEREELGHASGVREVPITCPRHLLQVGEQTLQASCSEAAGTGEGPLLPSPPTATVKGYRIPRPQTAP